MTPATATLYYVCDYCGHVEPTAELDDRPSRPCENCRQPLDLRVHFRNLEQAEDYSQAVLDHHGDESA